MGIDVPAKLNVRLVRLLDGRVPYLIWFETIRDNRTKQKIQNRISRLRTGNFGQVRAVGAGVSELKVNYGPGFRIYFGMDGPDLVILLCGGDKSTQHDDIQKAKDYWEIFKKEKSHVDS